MPQEMSYYRRNTIRFDFYYFFRCLKKNIIVILMSAVIAGVGAFVGADYLGRSSYSAEIYFALITRSGKNSSYNEYYISTAIQRNLSVLNSESLRSQMDKNAEGLKGTLKAERVKESSFIVLKATSGSARDAIRLLKEAVKTYPSLSVYLGPGYFLNQMNPISVHNIVASRRSPILYGAMGVFMAFAAGAGLIFLYCMYSPYIYDASVIRNSIDIDLIGTLHRVKKGKGQKALLIRDDRTDISYNEEMERLTLAVKRLMDEKNHKILTVNSIYVNEGKTTVSANIALNLARYGKRVLLIDGDMRKAAIAKVFDYEMQGEQSFSDFLEGNVRLKDVLMQDPEQENLYFMYQNKTVSNPDILFQNPQFIKILHAMKQYMDYIIVDMPPAGIVRDAEIMASSADAAIIVIRQDMAKVAEVNDIVDVLEETGVDLIGCVMNMADGQRTSFVGRRYYGSYYKKYGYTSREK